MATCTSPFTRLLPNEIISAVLDHLSSEELLQTTCVCHHIHSLVVRKLYQRLVATSSPPSYELILECYHPSAKISTPYLSCRYLGSRFPRKDIAGNDDCPKLGELPNMYSSFRPVVTEENRRRRYRMVWPVSVSGSARDSEYEDETATEDLFLDDGELFSQLCVTLNVVKQGKRRGMFVSHHNISESVVRVFRRWLEETASVNYPAGEKWDSVPLESTRVLWVDAAKSIGLRFRVSLGAAERMPLLSGPGEDAAVSYTLVYEELLVRTTKLLLAVEASQLQEGQSGAGNSIILSSSA